MSVTGFNRARRSYPAQKKSVTQQSVVVEDTATDSVDTVEEEVKTETPAVDTEEIVQRKRTKKTQKTTD